MKRKQHNIYGKLFPSHSVFCEDSVLYYSFDYCWKSKILSLYSPESETKQGKTNIMKPPATFC
jgi:hypothetical protein